MVESPTSGTTNNGFVNDNSLLERKRFVLAVIVIVLWVALGVLGVIFGAYFYDLSVYFISLTGFVGAYIISETKRPSISTSVFRKGRASKREVTIYVVISLWLILGVFGIMYAIDLIEAAAYFSALTPYISTYLIGSAYKPELPKSAREQIYQQSAYGNGGMYGGGYWGTYGGFGASGVVPTNTSILTDTEQNVHYTPPHIEDP